MCNVVVFAMDSGGLAYDDGNGMRCTNSREGAFNVVQSHMYKRLDEAVKGYVNPIYRKVYENEPDRRHDWLIYDCLWVGTEMDCYLLKAWILDMNIASVYQWIADGKDPMGYSEAFNSFDLAVSPDDASLVNRFKVMYPDIAIVWDNDAPKRVERIVHSVIDKFENWHN